MEKNNNYYDKRDIFEKDCKNLLDKLVFFCNAHDIPFFWTACVENTPDKSLYVNDAVAVGSKHLNLTDDHISKHISILCGFTTVPCKGELIEIDMDDDFTNP